MDLFLSADARASALRFQTASIEFIGKLSPLSITSLLFEGFSRGAYTPSWIPDFLLIFKVAAFALTGAISALLYLIVTNPYFALFAIPAAICGTIVQRNSIRHLLITLEADQPSKRDDRIHFFSGPVVFLAIVTAISLILWALQHLALVSLMLFGWLTQLAGLAALSGTLAFAIVKGVEKLISDYAEGNARAAVRRLSHVLPKYLIAWTASQRPMFTEAIMEAWKALVAFPYGEAALWLLFLFFTMMGISMDSANAVTTAGICALSAVGVRATRRERQRDRTDG